MRHHITAALVPFLLGVSASFLNARGAPPPLAQVETDRILSRVRGSIITSADVRQARLLKLVPGADTDQQVLREMENRLLILGEINRLPPPAPSREDLAAHRHEWESSLGGGDVSALRARVGMSEAATNDWLRDDVLIRAYLKDRFGMLHESDRGVRVEQWINGLRQRAGLR